MEKAPIYEIPREIEIYENVEIVTHDQRRTIELCRQPYYNHRKKGEEGCPNYYSRKEGCPLDVLHISQQFDLSTMHALILRFSFGEYIKRKRQEHPNWTNRALANQRHWQGHLKSCLNSYWDEIQDRYPNHEVIVNAEAQGVNIQETLDRVGVHLEWCVQDENDRITEFPEYMHHVYFLGERLEDAPVRTGGIDLLCKKPLEKDPEPSEPPEGFVYFLEDILERKIDKDLFNQYQDKNKSKHTQK